MPPKRSASNPSSSGSKKAKVDSDARSDGPRTMKSTRWSRISGSGNADAAYKSSIEDPVKAYSYVCICRLPFDDGDDRKDESDWEDEDDRENEDDREDETSKTSCDAGKTCLCNKPAAEHPNHPLILSNAGKSKWFTQHTFLDLRCPDAFNMYTFNDHEGYGALEVVQNLFIDYVEAFFDWEEQWAVCEATAMLYMSDALAPLNFIDDSAAVYATLVLAGRSFLAMLAKLEHLNLLKPDSEVKNLGFIMALYIKLAATEDILDLEDVTDEITKNDGTDETFTFIRSDFPSHILAYAKKYNIKLVGPTGIDEVIEDLDDGAELPERDEKPFGDPWNLGGATKEYVDRHGCYHDGRKGFKTRIGGDALDITTWSSADRKKASFDGKDPLGKEERDAIKKGLVMSLA
ncbi:hypothetical protein CNMCM6936_009665 [Aspergillus lentulus]|uniref:Uncharacterized protein n=1 Tax=Aspergillus lentulus TaxID=293939 RepID=A0AAN5YXA4_ASPLE|nr:hypothetical protein CNMCM6069_006074 [Aspergillus lentulus]KAF4169068.1 hypothetical protein CNMCM6936_009665 [Aspergillus lentulus]KAF4190183.1 hypothetical protein CNMCM7927_004913 [Aspergillus lentulus]KAF4209562.1 hypothetical protein CNMCM8927_005962 [Aspergillus lentulus]